MKKLIISLVAFLVLASGSAHAQQGEGATGPNKKREISGAPGFIPYKEIQLVRFGENGPNATALSAGDVVLWNTVSDDGVTIWLANSLVSSDAVAGVVVSTSIQTVETTGTTPGIDYGRRNWGWIQVKGYCPTVNILNGTTPDTAGGALYASNTARMAETQTTNQSAKKRFLGFAYDTTGGQAEAFLDL